MTDRDPRHIRDRIEGPGSAVERDSQITGARLSRRLAGDARGRTRARSRHRYEHQKQDMRSTDSRTAEMRPEAGIAQFMLHVINIRVRSRGRRAAEPRW